MRQSRDSRTVTAGPPPGRRSGGRHAGRRRGGAGWVVLAFVVFAATRLWLLGPFEPKLTTIGLYTRDAFEWVLARHRGVNVYDLHARDAEERAARAGAEATPPQRTIEYPPLALLAIAAPMALEHGAIPDRPGPAAQAAFADRIVAYPDRYRRMCALFDAACFVLLAFVLRRRPGVETALRLGFYTLASLLLAHLLYERLDVILGALLAAATALLVSSRRWILAMLALAVAIAFKLAPIVVVPLWALGGLAGARVRGAPWGGLLLRVALRTLACIALVVVLFVPFYLAWGRHTLDFLGYHEARGLQIESLYASLLLVARGFGLPVHIEQAFGAWNLASPLSDALSAASPVLVACALGAVLLGAIAWARRHAPAEAQTVAIAEPSRFAALAGLALMAAMAFSKVLSPQYLLWVAPLLALAPVRGRIGWAAVAVALAVFALTTAIYPTFYFEHILGIAGGRPVRGAEPTGTTAFGTALLVARNGGLVALCILLARLGFAAPEAGDYTAGR